MCTKWLAGEPVQNSEQGTVCKIGCPESEEDSSYNKILKH